MRYLLILVGGMILLMSVSTDGLPVRPMMQGALPAARRMSKVSTSVAVPDLVRNYTDALNAHDPERVASFYTDDAIVEQAVLNGNTFRGREEIAGLISSNLAGLPNLTVTTESVIATETQISWEWVYSGDYTGQFPRAPTGAGQPITLRGVSVMELQSSQIRRETLYFDNYAFLTQTGALPPGAPQD